ncbi:hypothetical protein [Baekduia alba]|uniref:hypothetical protein n=1 Tax=Baekduia alba TaxID=2997333 RepID=UPI002340D540|nr:hypothetical protein [Baekduia alba]
MGQVTTAWGVLFAVVHAYWAAGGATGMNGDPAVTLGTARWLAMWSLDGDGATGIVITLYFLLGGLLFSTLGWRSTTPAARTAMRAGVRRPA